MPKPTTPQTLVFPLTVTNTGGLRTANQGSPPDIQSCVTSILQTPKGWRTDDPAFGRPTGLAFRQGGVDPRTVADKIARDEPRATGDIVAQAITPLLRQDLQINPTGGG